MFIHDTENWTSFRWNADTLSDVSFLFSLFPKKWIYRIRILTTYSYLL